MYHRLQYAVLAVLVSLVAIAYAWDGAPTSPSQAVEIISSPSAEISHKLSAVDYLANTNPKLNGQQRLSLIEALANAPPELAVPLARCIVSNRWHQDVPAFKSALGKSVDRAFDEAPPQSCHIMPLLEAYAGMMSMPNDNHERSRLSSRFLQMLKNSAGLISAILLTDNAFPPHVHRSLQNGNWLTGYQSLFLQMARISSSPQEFYDLFRIELEHQDKTRETILRMLNLSPDLDAYVNDAFLTALVAIATDPKDKSSEMAMAIIQRITLTSFTKQDDLLQWWSAKPDSWNIQDHRKSIIFDVQRSTTDRQDAAATYFQLHIPQNEWPEFTEFINDKSKDATIRMQIAMGICPQIPMDNSSSIIRNLYTENDMKLVALAIAASQSDYKDDQFESAIFSALDNSETTQKECKYIVRALANMKSNKTRLAETIIRHIAMKSSWAIDSQGNPSPEIQAMMYSILGDDIGTNPKTWESRIKSSP